MSSETGIYDKISNMANKYKRGDTVFLVGNGHFIEPATVVMHVAGFVTIRFTERNGGTRVRESRLFATREDAEQHVASTGQK